jgi:hypothetical protein
MKVKIKSAKLAECGNKEIGADLYEMYPCFQNSHHGLRKRHPINKVHKKEDSQSE